MIRKLLVLLLLPLVISVVCFFSKQFPPSLAEKQTPAQVITVIDGDTVLVSVNGKKEFVRLIGIDTPEIEHEDTPLQCYGREAKEKLELLLKDTSIELLPDKTQSDRDAYKRLLRFVFLPDGRDVGKILLQEGLAREYTFQENPYMYQKEYLSIQKQAKDNVIGLWEKCKEK